jgi:hypothetical protein
MTVSIYLTIYPTISMVHSHVCCINIMSAYYLKENIILNNNNNVYISALFYPYQRIFFTTLITLCLNIASLCILQSWWQGCMINERKEINVIMKTVKLLLNKLRISNLSGIRFRPFSTVHGSFCRFTATLVQCQDSTLN